MAQSQLKTSRIETPLQRANAGEFYNVFNPPYPIIGICRQIRIDIQPTSGSSATIQFKTSEGTIKQVDCKVVSRDDTSRTVKISTKEVGTDVSHELNLEVTDDSDPSAKWMVSNMDRATPYGYLKSLISVSQAVDNHFGQN